MTIKKCIIFILLQIFNYNLFAQKSSEIAFENGSNDPTEIFLKEPFERDNDNLMDLAVDPKELEGLELSTKNTLTTSTNRKKTEENYLGLNWSLGYGVGYSTHAASYFIDDLFRVKEYSGFRTIVLDTKIGWSFHENVAIFGTWKYSPGNTTISPFRSNYFGGGLACYFGDFRQFSIHGGMGKYQAKVGRDELFGNGLLINYGLVVKLNDNLGFELNVLSGKIEPDNNNLVISNSKEFNFTGGVSFLF